MKIITSATLSALPEEVKSLVRSGVYCLYTVSEPASASYLLVTNRDDFYLLSSTGEPVPAAVRDYEDVQLLEAVGFSDGAAEERLAHNWN
ncbi:MAG TPA: hypothetical protein VEQ59_13715 [Polyangiaceae bacterium]|nr:hypothetical protein [Polyangiaceae bacterium]